MIYITVKDDVCFSEIKQNYLYATFIPSYKRKIFLRIKLLYIVYRSGGHKVTNGFLFEPTLSDER